ncbi:hypothetical protein DITRI_Ditri05aG0057500 [Diplodiscus trichospermus]
MGLCIVWDGKSFRPCTATPSNSYSKCPSSSFQTHLPQPNYPPLFNPTLSSFPLYDDFIYPRIKSDISLQIMSLDAWVILGNEDESAGDSEGSLWKAIGNFGKQQSIEDVLRQQIEKQEYFNEGSGKIPPRGGGGGGGGFGGSEDEGLSGILDETLQVILATIGFIFLYVYIITGEELVRLAKDYIKFLFGGSKSVRLRRAMYKWRKFFEKLIEKKEYDKYWLEKAIITMPTWLDRSLYLQNHILNLYLKCGDLINGHKLFDEMPQRNVVSCLAMVSGFTQHGFFNEALSLFIYMLRDGTSKPNELTFVNVLQTCSLQESMNTAYQVYAVVLRLGFGSTVFLVNVFLTALMRHGTKKEALEVFQRCSIKDIVTWNVMLSGYLENSSLDLPELWVQMNNEGIKSYCFTFASVLTGLASIGYLNYMGLQVHGQIVKSRHGGEICVGNSLVDMYIKNQRLFDGNGLSLCCFMNNNDNGVCTNGQVREALRIFDEMIMKGIRPYYITYVCVLYACSQGMFIDEAWNYFSSITINHGISHGEDHYIYMVHLLSQAGHIKEAEELILSMPFQPRTSVWQTLLNTCQVHGDIEIGKQAAEHAINLDREDPSSYVLLLNVFVGLNNWDDVGKLRKLMETRDVKKVPGSSWIKTEIALVPEFLLS